MRTRLEAGVRPSFRSGAAACLVLALLPARIATSSAPPPPECRDRFLWPFSNHSIWNTPIGRDAKYLPAGVFQPPHELPRHFFLDYDYFWKVDEKTPRYPLYNQLRWGPPDTREHYCKIRGGLVASIHFPANVTMEQFGNNNAISILQPDNVTVLQTQPLYRCAAGGPLLAEAYFFVGHRNVSVLEGGAWGAHGGSQLSAMGGTLRLGELNATAPPIRHALKLELYAHEYYWKGSLGSPCFRWPAITCDGYHSKVYNGSHRYLKPGSLLAVPPRVGAKLTQNLQTVPAKRLLDALVGYGGYLVDDTFSNRGTLCGEGGLGGEFKQQYGYEFGVRSGPFYEDMVAIFQALEVVNDNDPWSIGGRGARLRPYAPPICGA